MTRAREVAEPFAREAFCAALDAKRVREGVSWRDVARETGVCPATLTRLMHGKDPGINTFARLAIWLRADVRQFFRGTHGSRAVNAAAIDGEAIIARDAIDRLVAVAHAHRSKP